MPYAIPHKAAEMETIAKSVAFAITMQPMTPAIAPGTTTKFMPFPHEILEPLKILDLSKNHPKNR